MPNYPRLVPLIAGLNPSHSAAVFQNQVIPYLVNVWMDDYCRIASDPKVIVTSVEGFSYLFDVAVERLIAAWGLSHGRHGEARDKSRMAGHPLSAGSLYHRGHAIPHTLGGGTDINLVPQLGSVNIGAFRVLEKRAVATPGALYFSYWTYADAESQTPQRAEQGLLIPGAKPEIRIHRN